MWNQLLFAGVKIRLVVDLIKFLGKSLKNENMEVILAIPPTRGYFVSSYINWNSAHCGCIRVGRLHGLSAHLQSQSNAKNDI